MSSRQSEEWRREVRSFLSTVPGRAAALASSPRLPSQQVPSLDGILALFIQWLEEGKNPEEIANVYARMMFIPFRAADMRIINDLIEQYHGTEGWQEIQRSAADINRKQGKMPWPTT